MNRSNINGAGNYEMIEHDDMVEVWPKQVSIDESSSDDECRPMSDSDLANVDCTDQIARQMKGPSSDALESQCANEHRDRLTNDDDGWLDVLGDGRQLMRKIIVEGSGLPPKNAHYVTISVHGNVIGQSESIDVHNQLRFLLGFGDVIDAWELVVQLMRPGEVDLVKTDARFAYGSIGLPGQVGPNESLQYRIELLNVDQSDLAFSQMSLDNLRQFLIERKDRGNYYYSRNEFDRSISVYKRAIDAVIDRSTIDDSINQLIAVLHVNMAACYIKLDCWEQSLESANQAIHIDNTNAKAHYRRGTALIHMHEFRSAISALQCAIRLEPTSMHYKVELDRAIHLSKVENEKEMRMYGRMLRGVSSNDESKTAIERNWIMTIFTTYWPHIIVVCSAIFIIILLRFIY